MDFSGRVDTIPSSASRTELNFSGHVYEGSVTVFNFTHTLQCPPHYRPDITALVDWA